MDEDIQNVVILAGGKGTRMREHTEYIPKPMVEIGGIPILIHIINYFDYFSKFNYFICTGYKEEIIIDFIQDNNMENVKVIPTGPETNTGGRILQTKGHFNGSFFMTYGDGLSDINIKDVMNFHKSRNEIGTISVTNPVSRFGLIETDSNNLVTKFIEKPILSSYINMGYMIFNQNVYDYIDGDEVFENNPLKKLSKDKTLNAFSHNGFFRPMDTYRESVELNEMWDNGTAPWKKN